MVRKVRLVLGSLTWSLVLSLSPSFAQGQASSTGSLACPAEIIRPADLVIGNGSVLGSNGSALIRVATWTGSGSARGFGATLVAVQDYPFDLVVSLSAAAGTTPRDIADLMLGVPVLPAMRIGGRRSAIIHCDRVVEVEVFDFAPSLAQLRRTEQLPTPRAELAAVWKQTRDRLARTRAGTGQAGTGPFEGCTMTQSPNGIVQVHGYCAGHSFQFGLDASRVYCRPVEDEKSFGVVDCVVDGQLRASVSFAKGNLAIGRGAKGQAQVLHVMGLQLGMKESDARPKIRDLGGSPESVQFKTMADLSAVFAGSPPSQASSQAGSEFEKVMRQTLARGRFLNRKATESDHLALMPILIVGYRVVINMREANAQSVVFYAVDDRGSISDIEWTLNLEKSTPGFDTTVKRYLDEYAAYGIPHRRERNNGDIVLTWSSDGNRSEITEGWPIFQEHLSDYGASDITALIVTIHRAPGGYAEGTRSLYSDRIDFRLCNRKSAAAIAAARRQKARSLAEQLKARSPENATAALRAGHLPTTQFLNGSFSFYGVTIGRPLPALPSGISSETEQLRSPVLLGDEIPLRTAWDTDMFALIPQESFYPATSRKPALNFLWAHQRNGVIQGLEFYAERSQQTEVLAAMQEMFPGVPRAEKQGDKGGTFEWLPSGLIVRYEVAAAEKAFDIRDYFKVDVLTRDPIFSRITIFTPELDRVIRQGRK